MLTGMQSAMVLATLRDPSAGLYIVQDLCECPEPLDLARLRQAWQVLAAHHPILSTTIDAANPSALTQTVGADSSLPWTELAEAVSLESFLAADRARGFDFAAGVPMRMAFLRPSTLIWTSHHALLDGHSYAIVWRDWFAIYDALSAGASPMLPPARPFSDHLAWLKREDFGVAEPFWREHLSGITRATGFIVDRLRLDAEAGVDPVARERVAFSLEQTAAIRAFARRHDLTVGTILQAAWALLLSRYGGTRDVVFGVTRSGRRSGPPGAMDIVGPLVNTLPFRVAAQPDALVLPWLRRIREQTVSMRPHEHTPLQKIREWNLLPPQGRPFDTSIVYEFGRFPPSKRRFTRLQRTDIPLTLAAVGSPALTLEVVYHTRHFCRETAAAIAAHLRSILSFFLAHPEMPLSRISLSNPIEVEPLVEPELCVHQLFEREATLHPDATAIDHLGERIAYAQLNEQADRLANALRAQGVAPGDLVGISLDRSPEIVALIFATLKAGAGFVLLPPDLPPPRRAAMLEDAQPKLVVSADEFKTLDGPALPVQHAASLDHPAYAAFTSGSTGRPKGALHTHRAIANHTLQVARIYGVSRADRRLQFASLASDMFVSEVFTYLCSGATLVFCLNQSGHSMTEFLDLLAAHRITIAGMPASWWNEWAAALASGQAGIPGCLRALIVGMERVNPATLAAFRRATGPLRLFNAYGPTETAATTTIYEAGTSRWESQSLFPIGKAIPNTRVYLLDDEGNPAPLGVPGEIYIAGMGVAREYLNSPDLTACSFLTDIFSRNPEHRMFRTGDRAFALPDGNYVFLGRAGRQVKIRGFRVEPEEIEAALAAHPAVRHCAVLPSDNRGRTELIAYLAVNASPPPTASDVRLHLRRSLPEYMIPASFRIVPQMPMTPNGKIDRAALALTAAPVENPEAFTAPATPAEKRLAALWGEVLNAERVSATANFFDAGGDSLEATRLMTHIRREFGRDFPYTEFLRNPTIAGMARVLQDGANPDRPAAHGITIAYSADGGRPPLFCLTSQERDLYIFRHLANHMDRDQPVFVLNVPVRELSTVEILAAHISEQIRATRPHGPYILGGYCFGGIVAFEVAHRLIAARAEVPLVAFFDTPAPGYPRLLGSRRVAARFRTAPTTDPGVAAARLYHPQPIAAHLVQFIAQDQTVRTRLLQDPRLAWRRLTRATFQVCRVPGGHITWLHEPHVRHTAARLTEALASITPAVAR